MTKSQGCLNEIEHIQVGMPTNWWMDSEMSYIYTMGYSAVKKNKVWKKMGGAKNNHPKWGSSDPERKTLHVLSYVSNNF